MPSTELLREELKRVQYQSRYKALLRSTLYFLIIIAAVAVLIAIAALGGPALRIRKPLFAPPPDSPPPPAAP